MAKNINYLPYLRVENPDKTKGREIDNFLARKFRKGISTICPLHYYLTPSTKDVLKFIKATSKKYHYFLRLDIKHYYPSISHKVLLQKLPQIHQALFQKNSSRRLKRVFEKEIPAFLKPISFGLPVSSRLSRTLAALFLLDLDLKIKNPFLRQVDDYLIFCRDKKEAEEILSGVVLPKLKELNLSLNQKKLKSGRFHQNRVDFLGFELYAGYFQIKEEKIERFKRKIKSLTSLIHHYSEKNLIKLLNNQILGFGHYYKLASSKKAFQDLDAFIRMRLRRYLLHQKVVKSKESNLILTKEVLANIGLKSLLEIKEEFDSSLEGRKFSKKTIQKKSKKPPKQSQKWLNENNSNWFPPEGKAMYYQQKLISSQLKEVTSSLKKIERRLTRLKH